MEPRRSWSPVREWYENAMARFMVQRYREINSGSFCGSNYIKIITL